ncbi:uncharacterized protein LAESUDRAFT_736490 [Laetiporus sulphureus 93-53]|uniref:Uncharacterized protein n=1 Tax=Laetiporus sulphureus 93-53 TaxID=1314785 RepID=A0A165EK62_9APHY|nr:uncharacterized protein LAESUDRAFT_736490 [Laetiporus sulphureus 93-53]KZT07225.1 hypothetical protein LAESUDRAFT_736490 [Laetiporus sulphureus 93-53]
MRRSLSSAARKRDRSPLDSGMYSTPEERSPPVRSRYNVHDAPRPTIQQIAMGLHTSRTPHLRQPHNSNPPSPHPSAPHSAYPGENDSRRASRFLKPPSANSHRRSASTSSTIPLPPPPARSALKKRGTPTTSPGASAVPLTPSVSDLSLSESTLTSNAPSTPRSNRGFSVSKLLRVPSRKGSGASSEHSDDDSVSTELTPRKIVRFSTSPTVSEPAIATATLS